MTPELPSLMAKAIANNVPLSLLMLTLISFVAVVWVKAASRIGHFTHYNTN